MGEEQGVSEHWMQQVSVTDWGEPDYRGLTFLKCNGKDWQSVEFPVTREGFRRQRFPFDCPECGETITIRTDVEDWVFDGKGVLVPPEQLEELERG